MQHGGAEGGKHPSEIGARAAAAPGRWAGSRDEGDEEGGTGTCTRTQWKTRHHPAANAYSVTQGQFKGC